MKFSIEELTIIAQDFLKKEYDLTLTIPIEISARMTSKLGSFRYKRSKIRVPIVIRLSKNCVTEQSKDVIIDILKHELVHYACFVNDKPHCDKDEYFKNELDRLGVSRTRTHQYKGNVYQYHCKNCNYTFSTRMKGYEKKYVHSKCRGEFSFIGEVMEA